MADGHNRYSLPVACLLDDAFGWSVAVDGYRMVVGAPGDDGKGSNAGAVYVFEKSGGTWLQTKKLQASDGAAGDVYGFSVAVSGDRIAVGAIGHGGRHRVLVYRIRRHLELD